MDICRELTALIKSGIYMMPFHLHAAKDGKYLTFLIDGNWYSMNDELVEWEANDAGGEVVRCTDDIIKVCMKKKQG